MWDKPNFIYQTVSCQEACMGWAQDYMYNCITVELIVIPYMTLWINSFTWELYKWDKRCIVIIFDHMSPMYIFTHSYVVWLRKGRWMMLKLASSRTLVLEEQQW